MTVLDACTLPSLQRNTYEYVYMMEQGFDYKAAFILPEPRLQREARTRKDSDQWAEAEAKELSTLWEMGTFMLVQ